MDSVWLNRLGILFNFIAGFLIAPELIGIDRLKKAELHIEERIEAVIKRTSLAAGAHLVSFVMMMSDPQYVLNIIVTICTSLTVLAIVLVATLGSATAIFVAIAVSLLLVEYAFLVASGLTELAEESIPFRYSDLRTAVEGIMSELYSTFCVMPVRILWRTTKDLLA